MAQELYILGNGFDLWQGLLTRYEDYFETKKEKIEKFWIKFNEIFFKITSYNDLNDRPYFQEENLKELIEKLHNELNENLFFYYLLFCKKEQEWYEVETNIVSYVNNIREIFEYKADIKDIVKYAKNHEEYKYFIIVQMLIESELDVKTAIKVALEHLNLFEKDFGNYIKDVQNKLAHSLDNILYNDKPKKIINFNYTTVIKNEIDKFKDIEKYPTAKNIRSIKEVINIHGDYENPIFGIDNQNVDESMNIFTKTYRILSSDTIESFTLPSNELLETIYFFGHSLSEADYSYFQSMFDYYSIYDSKIRLIFLYSDYDGKEKSRQENRVVKLINDYGKTLENKDKGKNLLHKLLLENRIKIYKIEKAKELLEK